MVTYVLALTIICSHVYLLRWSHAFIFTCFDIHILLCFHSLMIIHFYVHMLWWSYAPMSTYFDEKMSTCQNSLKLICSDTFMIGCSYVNMLNWSHAFKFTCHDDRVLPSLRAWLITFPLACMFLSSNAWMLWWLLTLILKFFDDRMLTCIDIHMFYIHTKVHTLDEMSFCSKAKVIV